MSAKTRQKDALQQRDRTAGLYANAYELLLKGKRDELQASHLDRALQLFKENRLAGAIEKAMGVIPSDVQQILSLAVTDVLPAPIARRVQSYGATYVGEMLLRIRRELRDTHTRTHWIGVCRAAIENLGLSIDLDVDKSGWIPPYARDPEVLNLWSRRVHETNGDNACHADGGCLSVGEFLHLRRGRIWRLWETSQLRRFGIHGMPYVPPSWEAPPRDPEGCALYGNIGWDGVLISPHVARCLLSLGCNSFADLSSKTHIDLRLLSSPALGGIVKLMTARGLKLREPTSEELRHPSARSIDELVITIRASNCLKAENIKTIGDLIRLREIDLLKIPSLGRRALYEIKEVLASEGLSLAQ